MLDKDAYASPMPTDGKGDLAEKTLRRAIVSCVLQPGERLSEALLVQEFALGRGSVRAALAQMKASGLVSSSPRSGWVVTPVSAGEIRELCAARRQLEPLLSSAFLDDAQRQRLSSLAQMYVALSQRKGANNDILPTIRRCERDIMELLAVSLHMPTIAGWLTDVWDRSARLVTYFEKGGREKLVPSNRADFVTAILDGRKETALEQIMAANSALETYLLSRFMESEAIVGGKSTRRAADKDKTGRIRRSQPSPGKTIGNL
jgi:DNA-binding GntR family transcriptional regulator